MIGLPDNPKTYSGVRAAFNRGRWKKSRRVDGAPGENKLILIHISELSLKAKEFHLNRHDEEFEDVVEEAASLIESWRPEITMPIRGLILIRAMVALYGETPIRNLMGTR